MDNPAIYLRSGIFHCLCALMKSSCEKNEKKFRSARNIPPSGNRLMVKFLLLFAATQIFLKTVKKISGFKNIRIRVDRALTVFAQRTLKTVIRRDRKYKTNLEPADPSVGGN